MPYKYWNINYFSKEAVSIKYWKTGEAMMKIGEQCKHVADSNARLSTRSREKHMYIDHITVQVKKIIHESREC